mgnify:CR=1 FL=1
MNKNNQLKRIILDLKDLTEEADYEAKKKIEEAIRILEDIYIYEN